MKKSKLESRNKPAITVSAHASGEAKSEVHSAPSPSPEPAATAAAAAPAPATSSAEAPAQREVASWLDGVTLGAAFDAYYSWNFNVPKPVVVPTIPTSTANVLPSGNTQLRYYDNFHHQLSLNLAELTVKRSGSEIGFLVDFDFGLMADLNSQDEVGKHIGQAFITYTPSWAKGLTFDFGKMATHLGYELIKAQDNWQYSRSTTFGFVSPFWNTGLHIGYAITPSLTVSGYLYNKSVNNGFYASTRRHSFGAQLKYAPSADFSAIYNMIAGADENGFENNKVIHEANFVYNATENTAFALELLTGKNDDSPLGNARWHGTTAHMKYKACNWYTFSPRLEFFRDETGAATFSTVGGHNLYGATLTNTFQVAPGEEFRVEFRWDHSTAEFFKKGSNAPTKDQATATLAALYSF